MRCNDPSSRGAVEIEGGTVACMATYPARFGVVRPVIASLAPQVDRLFIYVNETAEGFPAIEAFPNVVVLDANDHAGNLSANGKIYPLRFAKDCFVFTVDDDFIYPPDYVARCRRYLEAFGRACCVTVHGSVFPPTPRWYYERLQVFSVRTELRSAQLVALAGSGTFAFHQGTLDPDPEAYRDTVMVDLQLSLEAREKGLPIWAVDRDQDWLTEIKVPGLWQEFRARPTHHTDEIRRHDWSFECYRKPARTALGRLRAGQSEGTAPRLPLDRELVECLERGGTPSIWRGGLAHRRRHADYLELLAEVASA